MRIAKFRVLMFCIKLDAVIQREGITEFGDDRVDLFGFVGIFQCVAVLFENRVVECPQVCVEIGLRVGQIAEQI